MPMDSPVSSFFLSACIVRVFRVLSFADELSEISSVFVNAEVKDSKLRFM